mmetsp:Transcript_43035/g.111386  ORF Transcript_43035/g.111386 Transcript_43035/m.111386 type:complete len:200 (-) Transcript_43035:1966-2565(-)
MKKGFLTLRKSHESSGQHIELLAAFHGADGLNDLVHAMPHVFIGADVFFLKLLHPLGELGGEIECRLHCVSETVVLAHFSENSWEGGPDAKTSLLVEFFSHSAGGTRIRRARVGGRGVRGLLRTGADDLLDEECVHGRRRNNQRHHTGKITFVVVPHVGRGCREHQSDVPLLARVEDSLQLAHFVGRELRTLDSLHKHV